MYILTNRQTDTKTDIQMHTDMYINGQTDRQMDSFPLTLVLLMTMCNEYWLSFLSWNTLQPSCLMTPVHPPLQVYHILVTMVTILIATNTNYCNLLFSIYCNFLSNKCMICKVDCSIRVSRSFHVRNCCMIFA